VKPSSSKKQELAEEVLVWRMVHPAGSDPGDLFEGSREVTFGLMLPRCWMLMIGRKNGALLHRTHQGTNEEYAVKDLQEWTDLLEDKGALMVVEPQTVRLPTGVDVDEWDEVPDEWVEKVLMPTVDQLEADRK